MRVQLLFSEYDKKTGTSTVIIETKNGVFTGYSQLSSEDKDFESSFAGCDYALAKAVRKSFKQEIKNIDFKIKTLQNFEKSLKNMKQYQHNSFEMKRLRKEVYLLNREKKKIEDKIETLTTRMLDTMETRPKKLQKLLNKARKGQ